ncbi:hypothetical protein DS893_19565 [Vibrionales bacterium C3R12]|nr:hypothetical protein DS893_19565 [Vibrionales bacterium C3R12]
MKKSIRNIVLFASCVAILGCSTPLSRQAQQIMTVTDGAVVAMMNCKELGFVTGDAGIWGGTAGLDMAYSDAKNKAALLKGANAILITSSQMNPTSIVNAKVYNCSESKPQKIEIVSESVKKSQPKEDFNITIKKARKCQNKGGVWLEGQCVISID